MSLQLPGFLPTQNATGHGIPVSRSADSTTTVALPVIQTVVPPLNTVPATGQVLPPALGGVSSANAPRVPAVTLPSVPQLSPLGQTLAWLKQQKATERGNGQ
jgi:hypothetical protein